MLVVGSSASDTLIGGSTVDTAQINSESYEGRLSRYDLYTTHDSYAGLGLDTLVDIEYLQYNDRTIRIKQQFLGENYQSLDEVEAGNTIANAQLLAVGTDYLISGNITSSDRDFYKLNITNPTDIELELGGMSNNLSLRLWNDFNNNGVVNTGEYHTNYQGGLAKEYLFRSDRWAGTWYAEVWSPTVGLVSPYQLKVSSQKSVGSAPSTATDLGDIFAGGSNWNKGVISQATPRNSSVIDATIGLDDNQDWYKFSLSEKQKLTIDLTFADNYGSAWVEIFDSSMQRVGIVDTVAANEQLVSVLNPGNYYIKIFDQIGSSQNKYNLNITSENFGINIIGTKFSDTLIGGIGDDTINGLKGSDTLTGGAGNDRFVYDHFDNLNAADTILDFVSGQDKIDLSGLLNSINYVGTNPLIKKYINFGFSNGNRLLLFDKDGIDGNLFSPFVFVKAPGTTSFSLSDLILSQHQ